MSYWNRPIFIVAQHINLIIIENCQQRLNFVKYEKWTCSHNHLAVHAS